MQPITITPEGIQFQRYPFKPASVFPDGLLPWHNIREIIPTGAPPEIRTHQGEVLFVHALQKDVLKDVAHTHDIPLVERIDVWSLILVPFLDTEFDEQTALHTRVTLEHNGLSAHYCEDLWERFGRMMYAYNFETFLWEWVHLGLYDLFLAHQMFRRHLSRADRNFSAVYWEAIDIADRGLLIAE
ncbi:MAG: hypothetical protein GFH27_549287n316 [Chloroflexi bacterium AL-W]|nr:hypothetical protein [Chloroflexi bacterium AL-N1]NOK66590.1 hypothetical protein [Chloroflexi bacterium AL-N10]NOK71978.1 hypothetical protein [Chloroflexi bacterium AL-N5]NOK81235.1 hypothetical protein [Chloroflexi bacterium AL-W]NOK89508.1 hypothetical protein [Chloroflexi bacterium AL-N15]